MKLFRCAHCGQQLDFENTRCVRCGHALGYLVDRHELVALRDADGGRWEEVAHPGAGWRFCGNAGAVGCNWLVDDDAISQWCRACALNRTIPARAHADNLSRWIRLEVAKRRLVYGLLRLGLPLRSKSEDLRGGMAFDFLDAEHATAGPVLTGHANGVITINVAEADDAHREHQRQAMQERYRTLLGHFRHESGHYYWEMLVLDEPHLERFRAVFGDEREDYAAALKRHHEQGPPGDWRGRFISAYASMHPWEDWAEMWAHYLHLVDTLETAYEYGVAASNSLGPGPANGPGPFDPYQEPDVERLIAGWLPLTFAMNGINRSMGLPDLYPFVLHAAVLEKLRVVHGVVRAAATPEQPGVAPRTV